jgi:branched-chain amino acid transport system permease protein
VALRTRALTFAIVTLTLLFVVQTLAFNLRWLTNGSQGISVPSPSFFPYERPFYLCVLGIFALATLISWHVRRDKLGLVLLAIRDDEDRVMGLGAHVTVAKVGAFVISVGLTAMVGGVWAYYIGFVYPQFAIDPLVTIGTVLAVFLGGSGTVWGPALGAFILVPAQQWLAYEYGASQVYLVAYAAVFLIIILLLPQGILPSLQDLRRRRTGGSAPGSSERVPAAAPVGSPST